MCIEYLSFKIEFKIRKILVSEFNLEKKKKKEKPITPSMHIWVKTRVHSYRVPRLSLGFLLSSDVPVIQ